MRTNKNGLAYREGHPARLVGRRFGLLTVISREPNFADYTRWKCRCDCGAEIVVPGTKLLQGRKTKCADKSHKTPSLAPLRDQYPSEYNSWRSMIRRCTDPKRPHYATYGGRGIQVCEPWKQFEIFLRDMGRKPDPKFTIERDDVNGHYEPGNCRWIDRKDQGRNRRNSVHVVYQKKRQLLADVIETLGLSKSVVAARLRLGFTLAQALSIPNGSIKNLGRPKGSHKKKRLQNATKNITSETPSSKDQK